MASVSAAPPASSMLRGVDMSKPGKYPVVLGDSILNKTNPKQVYTDNHKPSLSTPTAPTSSRIKPSPDAPIINNQAQSWEIGFTDNGGKYVYQGRRTAGGKQVVLIFDQARQCFVLERLDSMFHMNLTSTPLNADPEALSKQFPHLEVEDDAESLTPIDSTPGNVADTTAPSTSTTPGGRKKGVAASVTKPVRKRPGRKRGTATELAAKADAVKKVEAPSLPPPVQFALPTAPEPAPSLPPTVVSAPAETNRKNKQESDNEDEDSDDDLGLTIEYPGGKGEEYIAPAAIIGTRTFAQLLEEDAEENQVEEPTEIDFNFDVGDDEGEVGDTSLNAEPAAVHSVDEVTGEHGGNENEVVSDEDEGVVDSTMPKTELGASELEAELLQALLMEEEEEVSEEE